MVARFDQSLPLLINALSGEVSDEDIHTAVFIRDTTGLLSVVFRASYSADRLSELENRVKEAIGSYARLDDSVRDENGPGSKRLLEEAARIIDVAGYRIAFIDRRIVGADWLLPPASAGGIPRIAFSSLKGGVGRSTALAVMAAHFSSRGLRVLAVDLDIEAPGIGAMLIQSDALPKYGTLDYLVENGISGIDDEFLQNVTGKSFLGSLGGQVTVIPAIGTATLDNASAALSKIARAYLEDINPSGGTTSLTRQIREMVDRFASSGVYDMILIDGRAGLHETTASVLLGLGAEVLFFGVDEPQTFLGYKLLLSHFADYSGPAYKDWWNRVQFVHAKAPAVKKILQEARARFAELLAIIQNDGRVDANPTEILQQLTSDDFDMDWSNEADDAVVNDVIGDEVPIIRILDDSRYRNFDPVSDKTLLSEEVFRITFGELLKWAEMLFPDLQESDDGS